MNKHTLLLIEKAGYTVDDWPTLQKLVNIVVDDCVDTMKMLADITATQQGPHVIPILKTFQHKVDRYLKDQYK